MTKTIPMRRGKPSEEGFMLLLVIFLLFLLALSLTVAVPRIAKSIQLDRERETKERGKQYIRAIQLYYRQFHAYPPNIEALVKTNNVRFLRKRYKDPMTGKDDWKPIHFGENKVPTAMGFFGQPLEGNASTIAGVGPSGGNGMMGGGMGAGIGGAMGTSPMGGSLLNLSGPGSSPGAAGATGGTGSTGSTGSADADSGGSTFGGAGIIGFEPGDAAQAISTYKGKDRYNEWEFVYDPLMDQKQMSNPGGMGNPAGSSTTPIGGTGIGGTGIGGTGIGGTGIGSAPPGGTSPTGTGSDSGLGLGQSPGITPQ